MAEITSPAAANSGAQGSLVNTRYHNDIAPSPGLQDCYGNIPQELRDWPQWVCWRYEHQRNQAKLTKVPYSPRTNRHASTTNRDTWSDFLSCVAAARAKRWDGVGFVLTDSDPFCFIDFDLPKDKDGNLIDRPDVLVRHAEWIRALNSYTEISPGGGVHVIVKGRVPQGRKREFVEVYSSGRYMTMTGKVWKPQ